LRILFLGDLVGRTGRAAAIAALPRLRRDLALDFVIVNGENAAGGFGITQKICAAVYEAGADVITTGNHVWDQKETVGFIGNDGRLLRPENFPEGTPGRGYGIYTAKNGKTVLVANLMGRLFMDPLDDPFAAAERILGRVQLGRDVAALVFDFHAEATSEKMAFAHMVDGRASLVVGTHTHVPTADHMILAGGTAYMSDAGMCGDYDSVIGMRKTEPIARFLRKLPTDRLTPAEGEATVSGLLVETDEKSGLARRVEPLREGGKLAPAIPARGAEPMGMAP
jgi:metallophosphoesterase (TIGR00282 family)